MEIVNMEFTEITCKNCGKKIFILKDIDGTYKCASCGHEERVNADDIK